MYLKSIDMYGFKSFAHKMTFKFDTGITGIVGPNGSGKSNIADAVRWVLGEQSAKLLRGSKMQDIIFAGTETRKPLGYCQVDLTIDNADMKMPIEYTEVTVSRRVYRSGEGEYYINGVECRLKDVHELFYDTGVGKEGYSIIGQGQIDLILSTKPEDRRALFDEAAGIVKYKRRKASAEKNLEEERLNLVRINDIIRELEKQRDSLKGQAETAKIYLQLKEALKKYEVNIFIHETEKLYKNIEEIDEKEKIIEVQIQDIRIQTARLKDEYASINEAIILLEEEMDEHKSTETKLSVEKEKKESHIELIREQISNLEQNCTRLHNQNEELKIKEDFAGEEKSKYISSMKQFQDRLQIEEQALMEKQGEFESYQQIISDDEKTISNIQTDMIERMNEASNVKTKVQRYQTMLEHLQERKLTMQNRELSIEISRKELELSVEANILQLERDHSIQKKTANQKIENAKSLVLKEAKWTTLNQAIRVKSEQLQNTTSKHKALSDLSEHYEGYSFSIKKVMELKKVNEKDYSGVLGVVADLIQVDKKYETALEIALGGSVQNIVTDNEHTAKRLIDFLRTNQFGRATFLPLTSIQNKDYKTNLRRDEEGFIGYASELVTFDPKFKNIVEYLLGRVLIVDNMDHAIALSKKHNYNLRIVTLLGELIQPGGSLTGGAYKNQSNQFLSRKREIEEHKKNILTYQAELDGLVAEADTFVSEIDLLKKEIDKILQGEYELNLNINGDTIKLKQLENEMKKFDDERMDLLVEMNSIIKQEGQIQDSLAELEGSMVDNQVNHEQAENTVKKLNEDIYSKKQVKDLLSEELTKIRIDVSSTKQQMENYLENTSRIEKELKDILRQKEHNLREVDVDVQLISDKNKQIGISDLEILAVNEKLVETQEIIAELQGKKINYADQQSLIYGQREEQGERIGLLEKDILRLQNSKIKYEMQRDTNESYMWDEYELTYNMALNYKEDDLGSVTNVKKVVGDYKEQIKALGDVNVNSIESFKTVSERYTFLTEQRDDLIKAEEKLIEVIEELNEQMVKQFKEKFKEITIKFNDVFQELFGGGKAMLELTEDEDILEAGIDINAQPPGKKLQSMRLLSGGEKAFTAISLLFAIQSLKPSPFCVLDEIEAALDDANVVRFAQYLKKLAINTQFIIITHRRGTMEAADSLYGITMQEKGVSTQVSVKLLENELS